MAPESFSTHSLSTPVTKEGQKGVKDPEKMQNNNVVKCPEPSENKVSLKTRVGGGH